MPKGKKPRSRKSGSTRKSGKSTTRKKVSTGRKTSVRRKAKSPSRKAAKKTVRTKRKRTATRTLKKTGKRAAAKKATGKKAAKKAVGKKVAKAATRKRTRGSKAGLRRKPSLVRKTSKSKRTTARKLTARQKKRLRAVLLGLRERLNAQINVLKNDSLQRPDEVNPLEDGTDAYDRQMALDLASSEQESLGEIDEALRRIDQGAYGICGQCAGPIEAPRLKALPFVRNCIGCQSEIEGRGPGLRRSLVLLTQAS